ncbi:MAG: hypothetical protein ACR2H5_02360 [Ktedonobacteraceae bacterium]
MTFQLLPEGKQTSIGRVTEQARQQGVSPETLVLDSLREMFVAKQMRPSVPWIEPRDDWERRLANIGTNCGISLTDEQAGSEGIYQYHD